MRSTETEIPGLRTIINIAFLAGAIVVGKRLYESVKKLIKASGQNPLDIDTKKI